MNSDLNEVTQTLGYETSTKFLSDPYPLGGYSGLEVGVATEFINATDLSRLGTGNGNETNFEFTGVSIGKGLFDNLDVFVDFVPFSNANDISKYGAMVKWTFFEAQGLPLSTSILAHFDTINIDDEFNNQTLGDDLMEGINLQKFAIYFGGGILYGTSKFMYNILDLSDPANSAAVPSANPSDPDGYLTQKSQRDHTFIGVEVNFHPIFLAAQIDNYAQTVYSFKIGYRL